MIPYPRFNNATVQYESPEGLLLFTTSLFPLLSKSMAENPSSHPPPPSSPSSSSSSDPSQYWCYHCDKRVSVETLTNQADVICIDCKNGFVELISQPPPSDSRTTPSDFVDDPAFGSQFLQVLRLIAQTARDGDAPERDAREDLENENSSPPPPRDHSSDDDFLRIELDGWQNQEDNREEEEVVEEEEDEDEEEDVRRRRRDALRLRIRDIASRATSGRNRILDWAEILMGLEDNSIEFRVEMTDPDGYIGNPEDYVDAAGYEALLNNLAETDQSGRRGPPPASKTVITNLPTVIIGKSDDNNNACLACAVCKDGVNVGETVKKLPCGHEYHEDCIVPWLGSRNTCPVCRYELPTDDAEYEEERKRKFDVASGGASGSS